MSDLLAIGEALVELNQPRDGAPFVQGFGGDTSNAMIAASSRPSVSWISTSSSPDAETCWVHSPDAPTVNNVRSDSCRLMSRPIAVVTSVSDRPGARLNVCHCTAPNSV